MTRAITVLAVLLASAAAPLVAQTTSGPLDLRVGKLEKEMKAVQRTVFPQGAPVQPDLSATPTPATPVGNPASAPLSDLTTRVDALEKSLSALTGTGEQNGYRIKQLEDALAKVQARLAALEGSGATVPTVSPTTSPATGGPVTPAATLPVAATPKPTTSVPKPAAPVTSKPAPAPIAKADPARKAAVAAIEIPATGDAVEDDYTYGFRLYTAKLYPEAQAKLKEFTAKYPPTNKRWSYAQNLLGRAYFDEGKPALASVAFYDNYQKAPRGERAADSLTWLGQALVKLKKPADACKVFDELNDVYAAKLTADQKARAAKGRADAKCAA
jgi:TolA-binding protein